MNAFLPLLLTLVPPQDDAVDDWPTFEVREIEGFEVHVNEAALAEHPDDRAAALEHLRWQLYATSVVLPAASLAKVREVPLWAEHETPTACMSFHPARQWLLDRDYRPPVVPSVVELANAKNFLAWTHHQPWMVLHELAHGLDFVHIGARRRYGEPTFDALWKEMEAAGRYETVRHYAGGEARHYGLNNPMEHFAESTEAYFGINDFYPFVRAELREFDPVTTKAIENRWGVDVVTQRRREAQLVAALEHDAVTDSDYFGRSGSLRVVDVLGWTVQLNHALASSHALVDPVLEGIEHELHLATRFLPARPLEELREWGFFRGIQVHVSHHHTSYVRSRRYEIQIGSAQEFLEWKAFEPCILIRALAGLWYDLRDHREFEESRATKAAVEAALARVREAGLYDSVLRFDGAHVPHPALRDARTFFAEMSESYFLGNDHFPFVRAELMNHDPETFALMETLWHPPDEKKTEDKK